MMMRVGRCTFFLQAVQCAFLFTCLQLQHSHAFTIPRTARTSIRDSGIVTSTNLNLQDLKSGYDTDDGYERFLYSSKRKRLDGDPPTLKKNVVMNSTAAKHGIACAVEAAHSAGKVMTICVADAGGIPFAVERMDGVFAATVEIAMGKAKTAALFKKDTMLLENGSNTKDGAGRSSLLTAGYILMGGGVPLIVDDQVIGSCGVSGLSPQEDAEFAEIAIKAIQALI